MMPDATNRILVFDKPGVLPLLVQGAVDFLAVVHSPDVERELASVRDKVRAVVIYPAVSGIRTGPSSWKKRRCRCSTRD